MQTINRPVKARYIAPEDLPRFDKRWRRAMSALNIANDERYLVEATNHDRRADLHTVSAQLVSQPLGDHHATVAVLVGTATDAAHLPPAQPARILITASPNSPNTRPVAHSSAEG